MEAKSITATPAAPSALGTFLGVTASLDDNWYDRGCFKT